MKRLRDALTLFILLMAGMPSVLMATRLSLPSIPDFRLPSAGVVDTVFPAATGGRRPYSYGVSGLPPGISFSRATRRARGTLPTVVFETTYTIAYSVTDGAGATASVSFTATVVPPPAPPPPPPPPPSLSLPPIPDFRLPSAGVVDTVFPAATGGRSPYSYSISGLPPGIVFSWLTRRARGTLPTVLVDTTYTVTYSVRDSRSATDSVTFTTVVTAATAPPPDPPPPGPPPDPPPPPDDDDDDGGPGVSIARLLPFTVSETGSGQKVYRFSLSSRDEVTVSLTGMDRDIDCRVNDSRCTNRGGTTDDSWSGTLEAGTHTVTVYPFRGGSGSWTLSVSGTPTSPPPSDPPPSDPPPSDPPPSDPPPTDPPPSDPPPTDSGPIVKTGVNVSGSRTYSLTLSHRAVISVELTGMSTDFDCTVSGNPCSDRAGTADDSWSGPLNAGEHEIVVYPYGGGSGDYTLTVSVEVSGTGGNTGTRTRLTTLVKASKTNISTSRTYNFTLARAARVDVALTGLTIDFDCRVGSSRCTNRWGTRDDSWSGDLREGNHSVVVYPWDSGPGNYSLTVTATETITFVATPLGGGPPSIRLRLCKKVDGIIIEETCRDVVIPGGEGNPNDDGDDGDDGGGSGGGGTPTLPNLDADNNDIVDHWNVVVTEDECSLNFDLNDRLGTRYNGSNTVRPDHGGVDIQANLGDPVLAWRGGTVSLVDNGPCGHGVDIAHDNGWVTRYCHFREPSSASGTVRAGSLIGLAGETGDNVTGVHTHISVITGPESRVEYFDHVDAGGRPTDDQKNRDGC